MQTNRWLMGFLLAAWLVPMAAGAAPAKPPVPVPVPTHQAAVVPEPPTLVGRTADGQPVSLQALRGQVILVMVWSTDCAVCLSKMPEIRANHAGWVKQGFQVISINTDAKPEPLRRWEAARQVTVPVAQQWPSLWAHAPGFSSSLSLTGTAPATANQPGATGVQSAAHLPVIHVLDRQGQLRFQSTGRMPAEVWDTIAELL